MKPNPLADPPDLSSLREVRALLDRHGLRPDKGFGQNFLVDRSALHAIVEAAHLPPNATVLEVGPGLGVLTAALAERSGRVISLELDRRVLPALEETTGAWPHVEVLHQDAVQFDHLAMPEGSYFVSNLPYQVATAILADALASRRYVRLVVLVQREVAERIIARPGESAFGAYSLLIEHYGEARIVRDVAAGCFHPPPNVTSSIVRIDVRPDAEPDEALFTLIRAGFQHRRKTLRKNLVGHGYSASAVDAGLAALGVDPRIRAEVLTLQQWRTLKDHLYTVGEAPGGS